MSDSRALDGSTLLGYLHERLRVTGMPLDQVFLMKLFAGRASDTPDLRALWPHTGFASVHDAATAFYDAYPHEDRDPYLADWIAEQIR